jgi:hypothetical protein
LGGFSGGIEVVISKLTDTIKASFIFRHFCHRPKVPKRLVATKLFLENYAQGHRAAKATTALNIVVMKGVNAFFTKRVYLA